MAWPATPLTTYTANTAPAIKAFDLNAFQSGINGIINGTYNLQAVTVTSGSPGSVIAPAVAGAIQIDAQLAATGSPGPVVPLGVLPRGYVLLGWALISAAGAVNRGVNIFDVAHPAAGNFVVQTHIPGASITGGIAMVTSVNFASPRFVAAQYLNYLGKASATVLTTDSTGTPQDTSFNLMILGE